MDETAHERTAHLHFILSTQPASVIPHKYIPVHSKTVGAINITTLDHTTIYKALYPGFLVPCCLRLDTPHTKYLYMILLYPEVTLTILETSDGKLLTSIVTVDRGDQGIALCHVDNCRGSSGYLKPEKTRQAIEAFAQYLSQSMGKPVFLAPGEATIENLTTPDQRNACQTILDNLLKQAIIELSGNQQFQKLQDKSANDRTVVSNKDLKQLSFILENLTTAKLSAYIRQQTIKYCAEVLNYPYAFTDNHLVPERMEDDYLQVNLNEGHGSCEVYLQIAPIKPLSGDESHHESV
ncbi:hypothetical protein [Kistimonas asteriae]|uniref:hypothetical protein n=1 Tax=Kistimonas asteriae TaxID=517724 RepID=UPI001BA696C1|nr:hypothetical protein [Kistimonas asteriae]